MNIDDLDSKIQEIRAKKTNWPDFVKYAWDNAKPFLCVMTVVIIVGALVCGLFYLANIMPWLAYSIWLVIGLAAFAFYQYKSYRHNLVEEERCKLTRSYWDAKWGQEDKDAQA